MKSGPTKNWFSSSTSYDDFSFLIRAFFISSLPKFCLPVYEKKDEKQPRPKKDKKVTDTILDLKCFSNLPFSHRRLHRKISSFDKIIRRFKCSFSSSDLLRCVLVFIFYYGQHTPRDLPLILLISAPNKAWKWSSVTFDFLVIATPSFALHRVLILEKPTTKTQNTQRFLLQHLRSIQMAQIKHLFDTTENQYGQLFSSLSSRQKVCDKTKLFSTCGNSFAFVCVNVRKNSF